MMTRTSRRTLTIMMLLGWVLLLTPACDGRVLMAGHALTLLTSSAMLFAVLHLDRVRKS